MSKGLVVVYGGSGFLGATWLTHFPMPGIASDFRPVRSPIYALIRNGGWRFDGPTRRDAGVAKGVSTPAFAGIADINDAKDRPTETATQYCWKHPCPGSRSCRAQRFIFASSAYVYSNPAILSGKQSAERFVEATMSYG